MNLSNYQKQRVLVTGAGGFIGRWIARHLSTCGADLWLAARDTEKMEAIAHSYAIKGRIVPADFTCFDDARALIRHIHPHIIFNAVGYGVDPTEKNYETATLLNDRLVGELATVQYQAASQGWRGQRLVHIGSGHEYGPQPQTITEGVLAKPDTLYGRSKLAGTRRLQAFCRQTGLRAITARLFIVYGPGEHDHRLLPGLIRTARTGEPLAMTGGAQQRDFTYVADVAEGLLRLGLLTEIPGGVVNLASGVLLSVRSFAEAAARAMEIPPRLLQFGSIPYRVDEPPQSEVSTEFLHQLLHWCPTTRVQEGVLKTLAFIRSAKADLSDL